MKPRLSILEQLQTMPKIPVPVMSVIHDESSTGIAAIAEAARIGLSESPSSDDASLPMTKESPLASTTGVADNAALLKNASSYSDNLNRPNSEKMSRLHESLIPNSSDWVNQKSLEASHTSIRQMLLSSESEEELVPVTVTLTFSKALWRHLLDVADGRGQALDEMLSERYHEFRELYGMI